MEETQEILQLLRENNEMLKEIVAILRKTQDPDYIMQENTTDFIMNIVANLIADDIEGINGQTINKRK
nr:MAG TPA: hypothetical protein [Caudoviricetes sp.]